jgi:hypothetical protein
VRRMRQFHPGAEWHLHEVRYVWINDGVFVTPTNAGIEISLLKERSHTQAEPLSCGKKFDEQ